MVSFGIVIAFISLAGFTTYFVVANNKLTQQLDHERLKTKTLTAYVEDLITKQNKIEVKEAEVTEPVTEKRVKKARTNKKA